MFQESLLDSAGICGFTEETRTRLDLAARARKPRTPREAVAESFSGIMAVFVVVAVSWLLRP